MPKSDFEPEIVYEGIPASPGIAFSLIHVMARGFSAPEVYEISASEIASEQQRFEEAIDVTKKQLTELRNRLEVLAGNDEQAIFEAHIMLLEDRAVVDRVTDAISSRQQNAEFAFYAVMQNFLEAMRRIPDPYLRERTADIEDVSQRVLRNFKLGEDIRQLVPDGRHILVAYDLSPSDTASMNRRHVMGFATEQGSVNSHTAILARALGIPAVVGLDGAVIDIKTLAPAILDGYTGKLILYPSAETQEHYRELSERKEKVRSALDAMREVATKTIDGRELTVSANIELVDELSLVKSCGAKGIGLYRTEFLLLNGEEMPGESEQADVYSRIAETMAPHPVIIRTLDAGGDKLPVEPLTDPEPNPFLGWRGIRVSLARPDMFRDQLRAILRASGKGKVSVMFPLISGLSEVRKGREMLKRCMDELHEEGVPFDPKLPMGIMIEVPSAAVCADLLAPEVDFFSIGTNDLIQYTVAADRVNPHVAELYRPTHPAVIRLIKRTIEAANDNGIWTGVCGEIAGDVRLTPLLIGLGVEELSVGPLQVPRVGQAIRSLNHVECEEMANLALTKGNSQVILDLSLDLAKANYADLLD
ncbi:phosphoenolpyruvate--protein phosphotransferase [Luteolibacter pohnpeiensis]|uniref:Phosphoenolpyruvate-protein phosphotransferase n=1 Tax=Luteolibacter pohnpeiensis TaxID=454153 RepID=A0A934VUT5_9BACT|nr:phosphoenolpyruvate--protein phosphotransferase [Luteolibacter pohnpeiensis]MBK1881093.1 phosphoenolpyruvate--protein phosphotransferase [Luteolibacter pohnpeiensis]